MRYHEEHEAIEQVRLARDVSGDEILIRNVEHVFHVLRDVIIDFFAHRAGEYPIAIARVFI